MSKGYSENKHPRDRDGKFRTKPVAGTGLDTLPVPPATGASTVVSQDVVGEKWARFEQQIQENPSLSPYAHIYYSDEGGLPTEQKHVDAIKQLSDEKHMEILVADAMVGVDREEKKVRERGVTWSPATNEFRTCGYYVTVQYADPVDMGQEREYDAPVTGTIHANGERLAVFTGEPDTVAGQLQDTISLDAERRVNK